MMAQAIEPLQVVLVVVFGMMGGVLWTGIRDMWINR